MKSKTLALFILSGLIFLGTLLFSIFKTTLGLEANFMLMGVAATISFGLSIAGLIIGLGEIRNLKSIKNWIGLWGNLVVLGLFVLIIVLSFE